VHFGGVARGAGWGDSNARCLLTHEPTEQLMISACARTSNPNRTSSASQTIHDRILACILQLLTVHCHSQVAFLRPPHFVKRCSFVKRFNSIPRRPLTTASRLLTCSSVLDLSACKHTLQAVISSARLHSNLPQRSDTYATSLTGTLSWTSSDSYFTGKFVCVDNWLLLL
jgi:hypothetical protein